ncbi:MAG: TrkH family potassium uptake protein [Tissierellales bacterium]|jgi:trk system potassium uptake protein TrkH|nr:TrkH family potassium uptake protein [Tissierellales bacterium]
MFKIDIKSSIEQLKLEPAQVLVLGFAILIMIGATLLNLPIASMDGKSIGFIDALFTSASAVCVTGLSVVNTAAHWTLFGKFVLLVLIQIGGLGFMTMATLVALLLGRRITLKERLIMQEELNQFTMQGLVKLTKYVILSTFFVELMGAIGLAFTFVPHYNDPVKGIWYAVFHSISAFCNAGFDLTGSSMVEFVGDPIVNIVMSLLVIFGGLGYSVYINVTDRILHKGARRKFSLHTKMVLVITGALLLLGFVLIFIFEYNNTATFGSLNFGEKLFAAFFQSMAPRTAGFNSIDMAGITNASAFIIIVLMFIGGSPGSTAGGIKTTTVGALIYAMISVVRGKTDIEAFKKRLPSEIVLRSMTVVGIAMGIVSVVTMALSITESASFLDIFFESVSAFATVGLSRGLTPNLTVVGRLIITLTMFVGRLGPLTMAFAFAQRQKKNKGQFRYPEERIIVG